MKISVGERVGYFRDVDRSCEYGFGFMCRTDADDALIVLCGDCCCICRARSMIAPRLLFVPPVPSRCILVPPLLFPRPRPYPLVSWLKLISPVVMQEGLRFALREGGRTVGAGVVVKIVE